MNPDIFQQIFENSPVAMLLVDQTGKICLTNDYSQKLFGYDRDELVGQPIEILLPLAVRKKHPQLVASFFEAPIPRQMGRGRDLHGMRKDGTEFPVEVGLNPIQSGQDVYVMSSIIDMTQRAKAEERFRAAVEAAPNGMLMIDSQGTIVLTNKKTEEMFGYTREELLGQPIDILVPDEFKAPHPQFVRNYASDPEPRSMGIGRELFGRRKNGSLLPVEIGLQPIETDGELFVISSILDISQRRAADLAIKEKTEELEEFAYRTSHDLKTPLVTIAGLAECVVEDCEAEQYDEAVDNATKIKSVADRLQTLVQTMLSLTKTDLKNEKLSPFEFDNFIENFQIKYESQLALTGVQLDAAQSHRSDLMVQPTRLTQVLENLIANAVKYSDADKEKRFVSLRTFNDLDSFHIHLEDNGIGIPESRHNEVFGMFKRFHENSIEGSGLGLYMVKKHIEKLGGKITFSSSPAGTLFYLTFPIGNIAHPTLPPAPSCPAGFG